MLFLPRRLIHRDASVMGVTSDGDSPLHLACRACHVPVIELLMQLGARVDMPNKKGAWCFCWETELVLLQLASPFACAPAMWTRPTRKARDIAIF